MHIRTAVNTDLNRIMDLYHEAADAMVKTPYDCCWRKDGHPTMDFVRSIIESGIMLIALDNDQLIAAVGIDHDLGHDYGDLRWLTNVPVSQVAVIHLLVVKQNRRGSGLSRQLLRACLDKAQELGMRTARLDATANNAPAISLYHSEGFSQVGAGIQDVGPDDDPHVPFVVLERLL